MHCDYDDSGSPFALAAAREAACSSSFLLLPTNFAPIYINSWNQLQRKTKRERTIAYITLIDGRTLNTQFPRSRIRDKSLFLLPTRLKYRTEIITNLS